MPFTDQLAEIVTTHTITASETANTFRVLPHAALRTAFVARVQYWNASQASGSGVWTFTVKASHDKGKTWGTVATGTAITLSTTVQNGEQSLTFIPTTTANDTGEIWVQVLCTLTGSPVTPTIVYRADLVGGSFN